MTVRHVPWPTKPANRPMTTGMPMSRARTDLSSACRYWWTGELRSSVSSVSGRLRQVKNPASQTMKPAMSAKMTNSATRTSSTFVNTPRKSTSPNQSQSV